MRSEVEVTVWWRRTLKKTFVVPSHAALNETSPGIFSGETASMVIEAQHRKGGPRMFSVARAASFSFRLMETT
jgi:hypothetical protein